MSTIGFVQKQNDGSFSGHITTLAFDANVRIVPNGRKNGEEMPDFRVLARPSGDVKRRECELGGGWLRKGRVSSEEYISLKLDDPSFPTPLYANLGRAAGQDDEDTYAVIWTAPDRPSGAGPSWPAPFSSSRGKGGAAVADERGGGEGPRPASPAVRLIARPAPRRKGQALRRWSAGPSGAPRDLRPRPPRSRRRADRRHSPSPLRWRRMMKSGKSLVELAQAIEQQRAGKRDFIADTRAIRMQPTDRGPALIVEERGYPLTPIAHQQLGERVGIPAKYYERMRADAPELLARNVNHWFSAQPERRMVRTLAGDARAFLSDRYQRIDNAHVAEVTLPVLADTPGIEIVSTEVTEKRMYIKAVTPRIAGEVRVGDPVQAGVMITNSEVGLGAITVAPLLYRLVCLNGMVVEDNRFRKHHVGTKAGDDGAIYELLSDETRRADDNVILMKVRDVVRAALDETVFRRTIQRLQDAAADRIKGNPATAVEVLGDKLNLTEAEEGSVLRYLIEGGDLSRYGMIQAVTRLAQDPDDYDRATELERAGGRILSLDRSQWHEIKRAA